MSSPKQPIGRFTRFCWPWSASACSYLGAWRQFVQPLQYSGVRSRRSGSCASRSGHTCDDRLDHYWLGRAARDGRARPSLCVARRLTKTDVAGARILSVARAPVEKHLVQRMGWLRAAVLRANDGIISTSSLILGVVSAGGGAAGSHQALIAGFAGLVAGAMSMVAGEYVRLNSDSESAVAHVAAIFSSICER